MIEKPITDQQLKSAATLVCCAMLDALPQECEEQFRPDFDHRIEDLRQAVRQKAHTRRIRNRVIAATVAVFLVISMLLSLDPDVRAAVAGWYKEVFDTYTNYWFTEEPIDTLPESVSIKVPEGYEVVVDEATRNSRIIVYQKGDDLSDGFAFEYGKLIPGSPLKIDMTTDQFYIEHVTVNGLPGDLYVSLFAEESHGLIWIDEKNGVYFIISSYFEPDLILELAESVKLKK